MEHAVWEKLADLSDRVSARVVTNAALLFETLDEHSCRSPDRMNPSEQGDLICGWHQPRVGVLSLVVAADAFIVNAEKYDPSARIGRDYRTVVDVIVETVPVAAQAVIEGLTALNTRS